LLASSNGVTLRNVADVHSGAVHRGVLAGVGGVGGVGKTNINSASIVVITEVANVLVEAAFGGITGILCASIFIVAIASGALGNDALCGLVLRLVGPVTSVVIASIVIITIGIYSASRRRAM